MLAAIDKNRFDPRRRALVLLRPGLRLDLLNPDPHAWTDEDLAAGLARTLRWGGASRWAACVARTRPASMLAAGSGCRWRLAGGARARGTARHADRFRRSFRSLPCRALSDLDVAHKLARACGGEVIDTISGVDDIDFSPLSRRLRLSPCRPRRGRKSRPRPDRWGRRSRRCPCSQRGATAKAWRDRCSADTNSLHSALALFNCRPEQRRPRLDQIRFARNRGLPQGAPRRARYLGINVVDDADSILDDLWAAESDRDGSEECHQLRTAQRATTTKSCSNPSGALRAFNLHKASYREPRRALNSPLTKSCSSDSVALLSLGRESAMAMGRSGAVQDDLMATWAEMPRSPGHAFYDRLQELLREVGLRRLR